MFSRFILITTYAPPEVFYQRMLAGDPAEEIDRAEKRLKEQTMLTYYDDVALNGLKLAQDDLKRGSLDLSHIEKFRESIGELIDELGDEDRTPVEKGTTAASALTDDIRGDLPVSARPSWRERAAERPIICIAGRSKLDESAALMLAQLLGRHGWRAKFERPEALSTLGVITLEKEGAAIAFLSYLDSNSPAYMRYAIRRLRKRLPNAKILLGCWTAAGDTDDLKELVKADGTATTLKDAVELCLDPAYSP
jgi:hypothetical protein